MANMFRRVCLGLASLGLAGATASYALADGYVGAKDVPRPFSWTGFYVGIDGGWASSNFSTPAGGFVQPDGDGLTVGGLVGYNFQAGSFVFGIEADANAVMASSRAPCGNPAFVCTADAKAQATIRGRLGFAHDHALYYLTGGVAYADVGGSTRAAGPTFDDTTRRTGWVIGGGYDYALTANTFVGIEYLFSKFEDKNQVYDVTYPHVGLETQEVRARFGLKY